MGRAIKFDVSQFMNEWGGITEVPAPERPTAAFLRGIVRWVTRLEATVPMHTNVTCRHVSGPSSCGGQIAAHIMPGAKKILASMRKSAKNWRIEDLQTLAKHYGIAYRQNGTSHVFLRSTQGIYPCPHTGP